jgi:hypothetical protein
MNARKWMTEYGVALGFTVLLAAILGQIPLFRETALGRLKASDLVQFLGYGGAVAIGWLSARQIAGNPPEDWKWISPFRPVVVPAATLIAVALSYSVLWLVCGPFLGKGAKSLYNWLFIAGIVGSAAWLIVAWIRQCAPALAGREERKLRKAA